MPIQEITIGVNDLLAALYHPDDLGTSITSVNRAWEGARGHRLIRDRRPAHYQTEVAVEYCFVWQTYRLRIRGRIDGLLEADGQMLAEEIKTTYAPLARLSLTSYPEHVAQLQLYLYFLSEQSGHPVAGRLTYVNLDDLAEKSFAVTVTSEEGAALLRTLAVPYLSELRDRDDWRDVRNQSLFDWAFPFAQPRPGQDELLETLTQALETKTDLFLEAATGIGKTIGVLYPALKQFSKNARYDQIFFLTAKTAGKEIIKKTLLIAKSQGIRLRTVFIEAKERVCLYPGTECRPEACPCAAGYYIRVKAALPGLLREELMLPEQLRAAAAAEQLCPFELSLDLALAADLIVCDYNYVFDPSVYLKRFFLPPGHRNYLFLIDEAHNLVTRGREMYSAALSQEKLVQIRRDCEDFHPELAAACRGVETFFDAWRLQLAQETRQGMLLSALPEMFEPALQKLCAMLEPYLAQSPAGPLQKALKDFYFELLHLIQVMGFIRPEYALFILLEGDNLVLRLFCRNPGPLLRKRLDWAQSAVFFSATLSPMPYFQELLGGTKDALSLCLGSPFPQENRLYLHIPGIDTRYKNRAASAGSLAEIAVTMARIHPGNYLVFFPSYAYLNAVRPLIQQRTAKTGTAVFSQFPNMSDIQKRQFLERLSAPGDGRSRLGLAVLGGLFGEGVDLPGDQLVGVLIVGPGLPAISASQELIQAYFNDTREAGFLYSYVIPGIIRVIQSAGRVFRTPEDRGVVLLVDDRFLQPDYQSLLPADWFMTGRPFSNPDYQQALEEFWNDGA